MLLGGLRQFDAAQPLVVDAANKILAAPEADTAKRQAVEDVIALYDDWDKPGKAVEWRAKLPKD